MYKVAFAGFGQILKASTLKLLTLNEKTQFLAQAADENWWLVFDHDPETSAVKIQKGKKYYDIVDEVSREYDH